MAIIQPSLTLASANITSARGLKVVSHSSIKISGNRVSDWSGGTANRKVGSACLHPLYSIINQRVQTEPRRSAVCAVCGGTTIVMAHDCTTTGGACYANPAYVIDAVAQARSSLHGNNIMSAFHNGGKPDEDE